MYKILLFADIGGHQSQEYYHVGDEAMWYETVRWYRHHRPSWQVSTFSWFATHTRLNIPEFPHLHWPSGKPWYFFQLLGKLLLWRTTQYSPFSATELALVQTIAQHDRLHFTGGGNLSSLFRPWLYYCLFVLITARSLGKEVILTSQTVGPITGIDRVFACVALNCAQLIGIRGKTPVWRERVRYGLLLPWVQTMIDAAFSLHASSITMRGLQTNKKSWVIGLSLHHWQNQTSQSQAHMRTVLQQLSQVHHCTFLLLPHHCTRDTADPDTAYMLQLLSDVPAHSVQRAQSVCPTLLDAKVPAKVIRSLTAQVDMLITSRYHGLIFALAAHIPTIVVNCDTYYQQKNAAALEQFLGNDAPAYQVPANSTYASSCLLNRVLHLLKQYPTEKKRWQNYTMPSQLHAHTLDSILRTFGTNPSNSL